MCFYLSGTLAPNRASHLLKIALYDQMFDIGFADHKSLAFFKIDAAQLRLYYTAIFDHFDQHVDVFGWLGDARHDVELLRELGAEFHDGCIVLSEVVYLVWGELAPEILIGE